MTQKNKLIHNDQLHFVEESTVFHSVSDIAKQSKTALESTCQKAYEKRVDVYVIVPPMSVVLGWHIEDSEGSSSGCLVDEYAISGYVPLARDDVRQLITMGEIEARKIAIPDDRQVERCNVAFISKQYVPHKVCLAGTFIRQGDFGKLLGELKSEPKTVGRPPLGEAIVQFYAELKNSQKEALAGLTKNAIYSKVHKYISNNLPRFNEVSGSIRKEPPSISTIKIHLAPLIEFKKLKDNDKKGF